MTAEIVEVYVQCPDCGEGGPVLVEEGFYCGGEHEEALCSDCTKERTVDAARKAVMVAGLTEEER